MAANAIFGTDEAIVDQILERTRNIFLEYYGMTIRKEQKEVSPRQSVNLEVCVSVTGSDPDDIHSKGRLDLILYEKGGKNLNVEVDYDSFLNFPPIEFLRGSLTVHFNPFQWRAVGFEMQSAPESILGNLQVWARKWLLDQRPEQIEPFEILNVIHSVTRVRTDDQGLSSFWVDFGTAPKEAFWELLDLLDALGIAELSVKGDFSL
jgi:hypothetical protein